jgi:hypothetical protein
MPNATSMKLNKSKNMTPALAKNFDRFMIQDSFLKENIYLDLRITG